MTTKTLAAAYLAEAAELEARAKSEGRNRKGARRENAMARWNEQAAELRALAAKYLN